MSIYNKKSKYDTLVSKYKIIKPFIKLIKA